MPCEICGFEGRGFGFMPDLVNPALSLPPLEFCSMKCQDLAFLLLDKDKRLDMARLTQMELVAIKEARQALAAVLEELKLMEPFFERSPEDIDKIIEACITGFRSSMHRQSATGDVPF